jgi:hypothetical protein
VISVDLSTSRKGYHSKQVGPQLDRESLSSAKHNEHHLHSDANQMDAWSHVSEQLSMWRKAAQCAAVGLSIDGKDGVARCRSLVVVDRHNLRSWTGIIFGTRRDQLLGKHTVLTSVWAGNRLEYAQAMASQSSHRRQLAP